MPTLGIEEEIEIAEHEVMVAHTRARDLREKHRRETLAPMAESLKGTIWRYRNCYSCPEKEEDYWWKYRVFIGHKDSTLFCNTFQMDRDGVLTVEIGKEVPFARWFGLGPNYIKEEGWERINRGENSLLDDWGDAYSLVEKMAASLG